MIQFKKAAKLLVPVGILTMVCGTVACVIKLVRRKKA